MTAKKTKLKIDNERCKGCMLCIHACPKGILEASAKVNKRGLKYVVVKHPDECTGCALCAIMCPDCAIEILRKK